MKAYERFLNYVVVHTASSEETDCTPTTACQFDLSRLLEKEMLEMGMENVYVDEHAYVYGSISASEGYEKLPCIAFIAHLDTIPDFCGENVKPRLIPNYDGGEVVLGDSGRVLSPENFPKLPSLKGQTLIVTDGTTVLGADDKAGIAEIMRACERIITENIPHGKIAVCFTPDEEVGHGASLLDLERLGADFAYTLDGGELDEICYETFNAAAAAWEVNGFNVHPGSAKDTMINASLVAMEINSMLPAGEVPADTDGREGFFHLMEMSGNVEKARLSYIIRDHDPHAFLHRKNTMLHIEKLINAKYGEGTAKLEIREQYRNMEEVLREHMDVVKIMENAIRRSGLEPVCAPIRGGTDGSQLSFRGLPCPNIGTGGYGFHGPYEHITAERLEEAAELILNIIAESIK